MGTVFTNPGLFLFPEYLRDQFDKRSQEVLVVLGLLI
jgi:hypothetical protein